MSTTIRSLGMAWLLLMSTPTLADGMPVPSRVVVTDAGAVQGLVDRGVSAYKGMPYAAPPIGDLRFRPPQPAAAREGILDATGYGASCMQMYDRGIASDTSLRIATVYTTQTEMKSDNEDCLFLNLWTPAPDDRQRPVLVWFHGGGWRYGSGSWPVYDGAALARLGDAVIVTVNHRLNVFGYLDVSALGDDFAASGNAGLLDMVLALEWVRDNAAAFGGDADNVTILGESGGGSKVAHLLATPAADGLFHRAIIQSGPALEALEPQDASETAAAVMAELGLAADDRAGLLGTGSQALVDAAARVQARVRASGSRRGFAPVRDGRILPAHPFANGAPEQSRDVPVMIGWNKDEFTIFNAGAPWFGRLTEAALRERLAAMFGAGGEAVLEAYRAAHPDYSPTYLLNMILGDARMAVGSEVLAERIVARGGAPVYMYYLRWETPVADGIFKSPHTLDMPLMFANVDRALAITGDGTEARLLEAQMASTWLAFARTGDPNNATIPEWPAYDPEDRPTLVFDVEPEVVADPKGEALRTLRRVLAAGQGGS